MPRRNGPLSTRVPVVVGAGVGAVAAVVAAGTWWLAGELVVGGGADALPDGGEIDLAMVRWTAVGGAALVAAAAATLASVLVRREVASPLRQLRDVADRASRGESSAAVPSSPRSPTP
jgi:methyl-accepting chemotaxis protein